MNGTECLPMPLFLQPIGKPYCGQTCVQMVLAYHGVAMTPKDIVREAGKTGFTAIRTGLFFLRRRFDVTIIGFDRNFPPRFAQLPADKSTRSLKDWCRRSPSLAAADYARSLSEFWSLGGVFLPRPVSPADIREALGRREPCILQLDMGILRATRKMRVYHAVVPVSFGEQTVVLNDPSSYPHGRIEYPTHEVLHACYSWCSTAIFVSPPKDR